MKRHNQILAGILAVQIILSVLVFWPRSAATAQSEPAFPDLEASDIVTLTIADGDGNSITLHQTTGDWVLSSADDYPAQADKITPLLEKIAGLTLGRLVTRTDSSHRRLQVAEDDFVRRVDLETADGTQHTIYLGSSPSYGATHFRLDGQDETYLTEDLNTWETDSTASAWVDTTYLKISPDQVARMVLENENGEFTFTKDDAGNWKMVGLPVGKTLDEESVTTLLQRATTVNMQAPLGKEEKAEYGMDAPNAVVTLTTDVGEITLRVGAKNPADNTYVVISSQSPYYARVSEFAVAHMVNSVRDDFVQNETTPTPAP